MQNVRCSICTTDKAQHWLSAVDYQMGRIDTQFQYYVCSACRVGFLFPQPAVEQYDQHYTAAYVSHQPASVAISSERTAMHRVVDQLRADAVDSLLLQRTSMVNRGVTALFRFTSQFRAHPFLFSNSSKSVLDIGCGVGVFLGKMKQYGWDTYGVEPSNDAAQQAAAKGARVTIGFFAASMFPEKRFDLITAHHVVEHVHNPVQVLKGMASLLSENGCAYIQVPHRRSGMAWLWKKYWFNLDAPRHLFLYSRRSLSSIIDQADLQIVAMYTQSSTSGFLGSLGYWFRHKLSVQIDPKIVRKQKIAALACKPFIFILDRFGLGDTLHVIVKKRNRLRCGFCRCRFKSSKEEIDDSVVECIANENGCHSSIDAVK